MTQVLSAVRNLGLFRATSRASADEACVTCRFGIDLADAEFIGVYAHPGSCADKARLRTRDPINVFEGALAVFMGIVLTGCVLLVGVQIGMWVRG